MQYIVLIIKKIVMAIAMLYTVNLIVSSTGIIIPINVLSISFVAILGLPAVIGLTVLEQLM